MRIIILLIIAICSVVSLQAQDSPVGIWQTKDEGQIEVYSLPDGTLNGKIIAGKPRKNKQGKEILLDELNPKPELRSQKIIGMVIMKGFRFDGDGEWTDGTIYDPNEGKEYSCKMWLENNSTLKIRGYVGISLFGRTETWKRIK